jgi:hypothetical protein
MAMTTITAIRSQRRNPYDGLLEELVTVKTFGDGAEAPVATSDPMMLYDPAPTFGTSKLHANLPWESVVIVVPLNVPIPQEVGVWATPLNDTVTGEETEKPDPPTVYGDPEVSEIGVTEIVGTVMPNDAVALSNAPSAPVAFTV